MMLSVSTSGAWICLPYTSDEEAIRTFFLNLAHSSRTFWVPWMLILIDSSGLSVLVSAREAARAAGGDVLLLKPNSTVRSLIELTRLQEIFEIFGNEQHAVERLASGSPVLTVV